MATKSVKKSKPKEQTRWPQTDTSCTHCKFHTSCDEEHSLLPTHERVHCNGYYCNGKAEVSGYDDKSERPKHAMCIVVGKHGNRTKVWL